MDDLDDSDDGRGAPAAPARGARDRDRALHARFSFRALGPILVPRSARWRGGRSPTVIRIIQIIQIILAIIQLAFQAYPWAVSSSDGPFHAGPLRETLEESRETGAASELRPSGGE